MIGILRRARRVPMSITSIFADERRSMTRETDRASRRVVAPGDEHVAPVEVVVTNRPVVHAVGGQEACHGRSHAEAGLGSMWLLKGRLDELWAA